MNNTYSKGEIVWAKMSGFPWWPAIIRSIYLKRKTKEQNGTLLTRYDTNLTFLVEFYPDHSHCEISSDKIEKFEQTFTERSNTKKKSLIKAIKLAKKEIFENKSKFSSHILYDILGKKRYRERKRSLLKNKRQKVTKPLSNMYNSEDSLKKEKISKVIFDDDSDEEQKKKMNSSQTLSNDHSEEEDNYDELSEERIIKKIQNHLDSLLRIKIEMRGKEAHKQIMSSLDKLSRIFARKHFSLNFDSVNYLFI